MGCLKEIIKIYGGVADDLAAFSNAALESAIFRNISKNEVWQNNFLASLCTHEQCDLQRWAAVMDTKLNVLLCT